MIEPPQHAALVAGASLGMAGARAGHDEQAPPPRPHELVQAGARALDATLREELADG
jgi:hypothetical protein